VRRAILRVAFLAEVVLAMSQISFSGDPSRVAGLIDVGRSIRRPARLRFRVVPENAILGAKLLSRRRRSKNSGGRIAPAAIDGLYRGPGFHRQRLPGAFGSGTARRQGA
jgi:hypothetical protein